jgi:hypothetical protein
MGHDAAGLMREDNPFRRDGDGFAVDLQPQVRTLLASIATQMREVLTGTAAADDPAVARLYPTAYPDDPMRNLEFEQAAGDGLQRDRLAALDVLAATTDARRLAEEQLLAWMRAINDARLVLGVRLDVTEDMRFEDLEDETARASFSTYALLSALLEAIVEALGDPGPVARVTDAD